ncbi:MAG: hypothetical protein KJ670_21245 [Alphaproteobacteria bacterium]|nr:hypothetical protein [Rhizobiaceae bacterium]MBU3961829.1 hypothetical protein [Alphaproteobacteria bacterium]MBU4050453.1 hypothetical protein [Alphaproteobacteria bacterium]MBU4091250.1 hypothetical protein [Alphaproteobacteria bacterium]MBU4158372.1 hypothetical protein [Alphaproteobacteria bacterium]
MTDLPRQEIEGKLNAHREILVSLLAAAMIGPETVAGVVENLEQELLPTDGSEDPGLTPSAGYASGAEKSDEIRAILGAARERATAIQRLAGEMPSGQSL